MKICKCKLGDLLYIKQGYAFKSEKYVMKSQYRLCTLGNFDSNNDFKFNDAKATYYPDDFPKEFLLHEKDLVLPLTEQTVGLFGNSAFIPHTDGFSFVLNQRVGKVIAKTNADIVYLHYLLSTKLVRDQIEATASGTKQRNTSPDKIYDVDVWVPDTETQTIIGAFLHRYELKIQNNKRICTELEAMAKTLYDYWFTQFDFPDENGKPYRSSGGEMVWNDQLKREIPKGWSIKEISSVCDILSGYAFSSSTYSDSGKYKLITIKNVQDCGINLEVDNYIEDLPDNLPEFCKLSYGDILMSLTGNVGRVGIMYSDNCLLNQRVALIHPKYSSITSYLYILFRSEQMRSLMENIATGTSQKNLSPVDTGKILIPYDEKTVDLFCSIANRIIEKIAHGQKENHELTILRDWLLPMLMNGQATVE